MEKADLDIAVLTFMRDKFILQCVPPSCISNLTHICDEAPGCTLGHLMSKSRVTIIALKIIIYHCFLEVSGVLDILLNPLEARPIYSSHKP